MLNMFRTAAQTTLAIDLAQQLAKEIPPKLMRERRTVLSVNKITRLLERTYKTACERSNGRPGYFQRVALANAFKNALLGHQYPEDFADMATEGLIVALSQRKDGT